MNTAARVVVVARTAKKTCSVPKTAAARAPIPSDRRRTMFSRTTMASSTTIPVARTSASKVMMFIENPTSQIAASVPTSDTGMARIGISVARASRRNR